MFGTDKTFHFTPLQMIGWMLLATVLGMGGAVATTMYQHHNLQHFNADQDHALVNQMVPIVQALYNLEQQRAKTP